MKRLNQAGQGMTEYVLIVALIAVAVIGAVKIFGSSTANSFKAAAGTTSAAVNTAAGTGLGAAAGAVAGAAGGQ